MASKKGYPGVQPAEAMPDLANQNPGVYATDLTAGSAPPPAPEVTPPPAGEPPPPAEGAPPPTPPAAPPIPAGEPAKSAEKSDYGGRIPMPGDRVFLWEAAKLIVAPGAHRDKSQLKAVAADLVSMDKNGLWHCNVLKLGGLSQRNSVRYSELPAYGCWSWRPDREP